MIIWDGLFWHSERTVPTNYHKDKKDHYTKHGYKVLFFRADEILNKFDIIKSIVSNHLQLKTNRYFARKC